VDNTASGDAVANSAAATTIAPEEPPSTSSSHQLCEAAPPNDDGHPRPDSGGSANDDGADAKDDRDETNNEDGDDDDDDDEDDDDDDDDDDERPTIEEQRKLLSLAAEHDRVDVIQALLRDCRDDDGSSSSSVYESLLAGCGGVVVIPRPDDDAAAAVGWVPPATSAFVPPPLHVAVAHGSVHAASCLLRMGADPSLRPRVVAVDAVAGEDGRSCRKYDGMSAWELAFGCPAALEDLDNGVDNGGEKYKEGEKAPAAGGGWFGFGAGKRGGPAAAPPAPSADGDYRTAAKTIGMEGTRRRARRPLNIPPARLDGIRNAFVAEALRAVGSDEVRRLAQLLDAGMDADAEVMPGKTLLGWAVDMDARGCRELLSSLSRSSGGDRGEETATEVGPQQTDGQTSDEVEEFASAATRQSPPPVQDGRLSGLSLGDVHMLVSENRNLVQPLTACRDDLAVETSICHSILSGDSTLSSRSLLELVRALKDQRARAEDSCAGWEAAWEEREDELDFFWEEVLDDGLREELGVILDRVQEEEGAPSLLGGIMPSSIINSPQQSKDDNAIMDEWRVAIENFIEVESRVNALRASIANLAEESAKCIAEIERHGMTGALSLTRSLKDEVKEWERKLRLARVGEGVCRRKIDIIKQRIDIEGNSLLAEEEDEETSLCSKEKTTTMMMPSPMIGEGGGGGGDDDGIIIEDYQLRAIVHVKQQQEGTGKFEPVNGGRSGSSSPIDIEQQQLPVVQEAMTNGSTTSPISAIRENSQYLDRAQYKDNISTVLVGENTEESVGDSNDIFVEEGADEKNNESYGNEEEDSGSSSVLQEPTNKDFAKVGDDDEYMDDLNPTPTRNNQASTKTTDGRASNEVSRKATAGIEPSEMIAKGMSTAIVLHSSSHSRFFSSQIWELLKRIVGLSTAPVTNRQNSNNNSESYPHIMTV
jgi:hypothetical protein